VYNYHANIIWAINGVLVVMIALLSVVILLAALFKEYLWNIRRRGLLGIKRDIYELVLSGAKSSEATCQPFITNISPQQFIDIVTNRAIGATFFNDSEQQLLTACFKEPEKVSLLKDAVKRSGNKWRKIEAILCLGYSGAESAIDTLAKTLLSRDADISYFSIISLAQIRTVSSGEVLLSFLKKNISRRYKIASILATFPRELSEKVALLADDKDAQIRFWSATILSNFVSAKDIGVLKKLARDKTAEVRAAACDCLGNLGNEEAVRELVERLRDDSWLVKRHAVIALGKALGNKASADITSLITDGSWSVIEAVKEVMASHIASYMPYIEKFLAGDDEVAKKYSITVLQGAMLKDIDASTRDKISKLLEESNSAKEKA